MHETSPFSPGHDHSTTPATPFSGTSAFFRPAGSAIGSRDGFADSAGSAPGGLPDPPASRGEGGGTLRALQRALRMYTDAGSAKENSPGSDSLEMQSPAVAAAKFGGQEHAASSDGKLPPEIRAQMEHAFGADFGDVQIVIDDANTAAIGARAVALGNILRFAPGQYDPSSTAGQKLIGHELAHVMQQRQGRALAPAQAKGGGMFIDPDLEREADEQGDLAAVGRRVSGGGSSSSHVAGDVVAQPSLFGGILGGILGGVAGFFLGGPMGAIAGAMAGAYLGDKVSTESRPLTPDEIAYAREVFAGSLDYSKITITRDSMMSTGAPKTLGNTIHLRSVWGAEQFKKDSKGQWTMELTDPGRETLIHEMTHVWQYQNGGLAYIPDSLMAQLKSSLSGGSRNGAYEWRPLADRDVPWEQWNPEQQASLVEEYNTALRKVRDEIARGVPPSPIDTTLITQAKPYIDKVQHGQGAPRWKAKHAIGAGAGILGGAGVGFALGGPVGGVIGGLAGGILGLLGGSLF